MLFPSSLYTNHMGQAGSKLSPRLWSRLVTQGVTPDGSAPGIFVYDDFLQFQGFTNAIAGTTALPSTTIPGVDGYKVYVDSATTASGISRLAGVTGGVARLAPGATDNHLAIMYGGDLGVISDTAGSDKLTIFEVRMRLPTQVTAGSTFVGLSTAAACVDAGLVVDTGELIATQPGIGFRTLDADPDGIDFVYQHAGVAVVVKINELKVATANTWVNLGFVYDPAKPASKRIAVFADNVEQSTYVTAANIADSGTSFPDGDYLGMLAAAKTDATTARPLDIDCWAFYQAG